MFPWSAAGFALSPHGNAPVERSNSFQRLVPVSATLHGNKTLESEIALHINWTQSHNFSAVQFRSTGALALYIGINEKDILNE